MLEIEIGDLVGYYAGNSESLGVVVSAYAIEGSWLADSIKRMNEGILA